MADAPNAIEFTTKASVKEPLYVATLAGLEGISQLYEFSLDLQSKQPDVKLEELIRNKASIGMKVPVPGGGGARMRATRIHGVLSTFEQLDKVGDWVRYRAVLVPRYWKYTLRIQSRIFLEKSIPDIVKEVLEKPVKTSGDSAGRLAGGDFEFRLSKSYSPREYVVQYQESDFDFISRWLEHEGIFYFFEQKDDKEVLVFADDTAAYMAIPGNPKYPYRPTSEARSRAPGVADGETTTEESVFSFLCRQRGVPKKVVLREYNYRTPASKMEADAEVDGTAEGEHYHFGDHYKTESEGKALAKVRAEEIKCRQRIFSGKGDGRSFRAGAKFPLVEHYRSDFNSSAGYLITNVRHKASQAFGSGSGPTGAVKYENEFTCIPADVVFRPERLTRWPRISGFAHAAVDAGGDGKYAELDDEGRYKVKMPLDRSGLGDGKASRAVRKAEPYGGAGMGWHSPLHKKTEVILGHADGDPDRPVIIGQVPNPETKSMVTSANQTQCDWKSGGNNEIRFEDQEGSEQIFMHAQKDRLTVVENDETKNVGHDQTIEVKNDRKKTINGNQSEHVVKDKTIQIDGNHTEAITGDKTMTVSGGHTETVTKDISITGAANKQETIAANYDETVGSSKSVTIGAASTVTIAAALTELVGANSSETVGGAKEITVGGAMATTVGGAATETVGGNSTTNVGGNNKLVVKANEEVKAKKIQLQADDEIVFKCGGASIVLKSSGDITIKGNKISLKGDGDVILKGSKIAAN